MTILGLIVEETRGFKDKFRRPEIIGHYEPPATRGGEESDTGFVVHPTAPSPLHRIQRLRQ